MPRSSAAPLSRKDEMQEEQIQERLESLKKEFESGQKRLGELEAEQAYVRETMLRISGAIQVLQELTQDSKTGSLEIEQKVATES